MMGINFKEILVYTILLFRYLFTHPKQNSTMSTVQENDDVGDKNSKSSESDEEIINSESSLNKFRRFMRLLHGSPHYMSRIKKSEVYKVVKLIEKESLQDGLSNMSSRVFLRKVDWIVENNILRGLPFCPVCAKTFIKKKNRDTHVLVIHNNEKNRNLSCKLCDKHFMSKTSFKYHKRVAHSSRSSQVECKICKKMLGHPSTLKRHLKTHDQNPDVHECSVCEKSFRRQDKLTHHRRKVHKLVNINLEFIESLKKGQTYTCKVCDMSFSGQDAKFMFVEHLSNKCKPDVEFSCDSCDKPFSTKYNLEQHKKTIHYDVAKTLFSCKEDFCGFITKYKTSLTRHKKRLHAGI